MTPLPFPPKTCLMLFILKAPYLVPLIFHSVILVIEQSKAIRLIKCCEGEAIGDELSVVYHPASCACLYSVEQKVNNAELGKDSVKIKVFRSSGHCFCRRMISLYNFCESRFSSAAKFATFLSHPIHLSNESHEGHVDDGDFIILLTIDTSPSMALLSIKRVILVLTKLRKLLRAGFKVLSSILVFTVPCDILLLSVLNEDVGTLFWGNENVEKASKPYLLKLV